MSLRAVIANVRTGLRWRGSAAYWERRYEKGGTSGSGSYGAHAEYKAEVVNRMVAQNAISTVVELGCGDGNQLKYANYPKYLGLDVSATAVRRCMDLFAHDPSKSFFRYEPELYDDRGGWLTADAAISLEVIFHLVEDAVFERYLRQLFGIARDHVIICSSDREDLPRAPQERHRRFTPWIAANLPGWELVEEVPAGLDMVAGFYRYARVQ